ncbi:MAG: WD40 repeat domain-containing protein, partial [Geminicoccaceae bacterium]
SQPIKHDSAVAALGFSPNGDYLAVAEQDAVTIWRIGEDVRALATTPLAGRPVALSWSPGQTKLGIGFEAGGAAVLRVDQGEMTTFTDYPSAVRSIVWSPAGDIMATSGAFRIIAWPLDDLKTNGAQPASLETGKPSLVTVEALAVHPKRPLIAAGYESGMLIITELGKRDELMIRAEGGGAITRIAWSRCGSFLALGSEGGLAAIVELPAQLFK